MHQSVEARLRRLALLNCGLDPRLKLLGLHRLFLGHFFFASCEHCWLLARAIGEALAEYLFDSLVDLDPCLHIATAERVLSLVLAPTLLPTPQLGDLENLLLRLARIRRARAQVVDRVAHHQESILVGQG